MHRPHTSVSVIIPLSLAYIGLVHGTPLHLEPRQQNTSTTPTTPPTVPATATLSSSGVDVTGTSQEQQSDSLTFPSAPSSGCILASVSATIVSQFNTLPLVSTTSIQTVTLSINDDPYCTCADGLMAGLGSSYNPGGTEFLYCATDGWMNEGPSQAISAVLPEESAEPGSANNSAVSSTCVSAPSEYRDE